MNQPLPLPDAGRVPAPGDNVAITIQRIDAGVRIQLESGPADIPFTILEGHRFAVRPIRAGEPLLSWGLPFGIALGDLAPGQYVCNQKMLAALHERHVPFPLPSAPNFKDHFVLYQLDERKFQPGQQVPLYENPGSFLGYLRAAGRGAGTRNFIVVVGVTSRTASYARLLAERFRDIPQRFANIHGVAPVAHTEGAGVSKPNNLELILRCLAGFVVHPNVGAALIVDDGAGYVTNGMLEQFMRKNRYPLDGVLHEFVNFRGSLAESLADGEQRIGRWLERVHSFERSQQPLRFLNIGMQCGGSDAFSGVSGNPLLGCVVKELIRHGGRANLAETDELIGAEPYILANVRDLKTARAFLHQLARFQERVEWHGLSAESNPSGGNIYRGLYNITIKSIGAARKKDPALRLDHVIEYGVPMREPGFYFMDSPGNDLESVAGQVGAGCNLIVFTTGNGSITNFPFVPTIKIMTNSGRYRMLSREMDVNAGQYLDGVPMDQLAGETFDLTVRIASGQLSAGERAGHSQVQLWREWRQTNRSRLVQLENAPKPTGEPLPWRPEKDLGHDDLVLTGLQTARGIVSDQIGLIVPTSLCSGQIGLGIAEKLRRQVSESAGGLGLRRFAALAHTEGCGVSGDEAQTLLQRTMLGYVRHPIVGRALLLEHGCEKTHNDSMRNFFAARSVDPSRFGWASVQLDGGIESVTQKVISWFMTAPAKGDLRMQPATFANVCLGLTGTAPIPDLVHSAVRRIAVRILRAGGTIVLPQNAPWLENPEFRKLLEKHGIEPTLGYGEPVVKQGLHIMETPTDHYIETLTGLGATGVEIILSYASIHPLQGHPILPVFEFTSHQTFLGSAEALRDLDATFDLAAESAVGIERRLLKAIAQIYSREYSTRSLALGNIDFQMTRGWLGVST